MSEQTGVAAALAEDNTSPISLRDQVSSAPPVDLFDDALDECDQAAAAQGFALPGRMPGRPKGSRNRSTELTKKVIRAIGGDPHLAAARLVAGGPGAVLAMAKAAYIQAYGGTIDEHGHIKGTDGQPVQPLDIKDAITVWQRAGDFLGPYVMSKEALKVDFEGDGLNVSIHLGGSPAAGPDIGGQAQASTGYTLTTTKSDTYDDEPDKVTRSQGHTEELSD